MTTVLQDRIDRAQGIAARAIGLPTHAFRPAGPEAPLATVNRFLRLPAAFQVPAGAGSLPQYGAALWRGIFDAAYTRPGDYLVQGEDAYFIAAQPRLHPVLCVKTNRVVHITRATGPDAVGANPYSGAERARSRPVLASWPASVLGIARASGADSDLPDSASGTRWTVLLPASVPVELRPNDTVADGFGLHGIIQAAECTDLGWRLLVTEVRI